jgi:hypothetical protein
MPDLFTPVNPFYLQSEQGPSQRRQPSVQPLTPEEQASLLEQLGGYGLHGLGWIGGTLSKAFGGRAIRGLMGGKPEELLSIIPGSDTFGITDPSNEVHGSELLTGQKDTPFFSPEGVAGLGVDILTDPATYLTFGGSALTSLGKAASKAGVLPKTVAGRLAGVSGAEAAELASKVPGATAASVSGQRLGGHVGLGIPFTDIGTTFDLAPVGKLASKIPGVTSGMEWAGEKLSPIYRGVNALFRKGARGQTDPILQDLAFQGTEEMGKRLPEALEPIARIAQERQLALGWKPGVQWTQEMADKAAQQGRVLAQAIERTPHDWSIVDPVLAAQRKQELASLELQFPGVSKWAEEYRKATHPYLQKGQSLGLLDKPLEGGPEWMHRQASAYEAKTGRGMPATMTPAEQLQRKEMFRGLYTEGPGSINALAMDDALRGLSEQDAAQAVLNQYLKGTELVEGQAGQLARWQRTLDQDAIKSLGGFFVNDPLADLERYIPRQMARHINAENAYQALAKMGQDGGQVPVLNALGQMNLKDAGAAHGLLSQAVASERNIPLSQAQVLIGQMGITNQQAEALTRFIRPPEAYAGSGAILGAMDSLLNLTKAGQTAWPATVARNFLSDLFSRFAHGGSVLSPLAGAKSLREGQTIQGIAQRIGRLSGMSDEQATQQLLKEAYQLGLLDTKKYQALEAAGVDGSQAVRQAMPVIGAPQTSLRETMAGHIPEMADLSAEKLLSGQSRLTPWNVRGFGGRQQTGNFWVGGHQSTQSYLEDINRLATYLDANERGYVPTSAMAEVVKAHHDFSNLSGFERDWMRRVVPYWSWLRQNTPAVASEISSNPGGRMAQSLRLTNAASQGNTFLPEAVSQTGMAVPIGDTEQGRQTYLTSLGLPFEDLAQMTSLKGMTGTLAPYLRVVPELVTGKQMFSGRDVPTNFPLEGQVANSLAMASPLSRVFSTANALGKQDPMGAAFQTLLGPRMTTVNQEAVRQMGIRDLLETAMFQIPEVSRFQRLYVRPDQLQNLSPAEMELYRLYSTMQRQASQQARTR